MKKIFLSAAIALISFTACGQNQSNRADNNESASAQTTVQVNQADVVNVYYFHGKQRCKTCIAVENVTKKYVGSHFANNLNVKYIEVNTDEAANKALVEKYQVTWNALIIAKGADSIDITKQAFANALNSPEKLTELIKAKVDKKLAE